MSSPRITKLRKNAIRIPPDFLSQRLAASKPHIPQVATPVPLAIRPKNSLIAAAEIKNFSKVCEILNDQRNAVLLDRKSLNWTLRKAADQGHEHIVRLLLKKGANVNAFEGDKDTALVCASRNGHERMVQLLLEKGANIDAARLEGDTALLVASRKGHERIVRLLLKKGADINARGEHNNSALLAALYCGHVHIVRLLLEKGASINVGGQDGDPPIV